MTAEEPAWTVMSDGGWRWRKKVLGATYPSKFEVEVQRSHWPRPGWETIGRDYAMTAWGAGMAAKKLKRRHVRRFGDER